MPILGLTGKIGSGKTTLSAYIQEKYGFRKLSFVDKILIPELQRRKKAINRQNLQQIGREFYLKYGDIKLTDWLLEGLDLQEKWIIDDIRYLTTANYIRSKSPNGFWLIGIQTNKQIRFRRILSRGEEGEISYQDFLAIDSAPTEQEIENVLAQADFCVQNNKTHSALRRQLDKLMVKRKIQNKF